MSIDIACSTLSGLLPFHPFPWVSPTAIHIASLRDVIPKQQRYFANDLLGVDRAAIGLVETLSERHGHAIWRVVTAERSYILKWLPETDARVEIKGYLLLQQVGVPTLPLYGSTEQALLLEDLTRSDMWTLAAQADLARPEVGRAVARWYRVFHDAGEALLSKGDCPGFLTRETDELDPDSILATGRALGLSHCRAWGLAADHIELLKAGVRRLSVTLNYNDFYWTNLALSRRDNGELEAVIFDYHLLGIGTRFSDCRNVTGSLSGEAAPAFWDVYGKVDPREEILDLPLAILHSLTVASRMSEFPKYNSTQISTHFAEVVVRSVRLRVHPGRLTVRPTLFVTLFVLSCTKWAEVSRDRVVNGDLEKDLIAALELPRSRCEPTA